jgi:hypothetical protein
MEARTRRQQLVFGKPADQIGEISLKLRLPLPLRRMLNGLFLRLVAGSPQDYGLPKPDHKLFETHPIVNSQMLYYLGHGDILSKPDVQELRGDLSQTKIRSCAGSKQRHQICGLHTALCRSRAFQLPAEIEKADCENELRRYTLHVTLAAILV